MVIFVLKFCFLRKAFLIGSILAENRGNKTGKHWKNKRLNPFTNSQESVTIPGVGRWAARAPAGGPDSFTLKPFLWLLSCLGSRTAGFIPSVSTNIKISSAQAYIRRPQKHIYIFPSPAKTCFHIFLRVKLREVLFRLQKQNDASCDHCIASW